MDMIKVDQDKCKQDGICAAECPLGLIVLPKEGFPRPIVPAAAEVCIDCGHCVVACPHGALTQRSMGPDDCPPVRKELQLTYEQAEHFLRSRRSIRQYKNNEVPKEEIERLIQIASYAPSGHNRQPIEYLVVNGAPQVRKLASLVKDWMIWMLENQRDMALAMNMDKVVAIWDKGQDRILRGAPHLVVLHAPKNERTAVAAGITAAAYLELAAPALGLGTCWAGFFFAACQSFEPLQTALCLPEGHGVFAAAMLGYPKVVYHRLPLRKPPHIIWA